VAAVVYAIATCAFTWPLALHLRSAFDATIPLNDSGRRMKLYLMID